MNYYEVTFQLDPLYPARDVLVAELAERGFESFVETDDGLKAYIVESDFNERLVEGLAFEHMEGAHKVLSAVLIPDENWNAEWEKNFEPIIVNDECIVRAPFHKPDRTYRFDINIEPKMSFGTGHHATTLLMMQEMFSLSFSGKNVLDMGCGTGVLAILAEKLGASNVLAIDIDDWAFENSVENAGRNQCSHIQCELGGAEIIKNRKFDVILANINRNILTRDGAIYTSSLKPGGDLLLSGFYSIDIPVLLEVFKDYCILNKRQKDEWTMLHLIKE